MPWLPIREASEVLGVSPDTIRRRLRNGALDGRQEEAPPRRWLVDVPTHAQAPPTPGPSPGAPTAAEVDQRANDLQRENELLRSQLTTLHDTLRHERTEGAKITTTLEQLTRALPAPAADDDGRRPWWRRVMRR